MANPFMIQPGGDFGQQLSGLGQAIGEFGRQRQAKQRFNEVRGAMTDAWQSGDSDKIAQLMIDYPEARQTIEVLIPFRDKESKEQGLTTYRSVLGQKENPQEAVNFLQRRVDYLDSRGIDSSHTKRDLDQLQSAMASGADTAPIFSAMENAYAALAGPQEWESYKAQSGYGASKVGAQQILPDGTIIQSTAMGPVVFSSEGKRLSGAEAAKAVKSAQEYGVKVESAKAGGRRRGGLEAELELKPDVAGKTKTAEAEAAANVAAKGEAMDQLAVAESLIPVYDDMIAQIDAGANTSALADLAPTVQDSTRQFQQGARKLGLGVISSTTFGALSEAELKLAMETAVPKLSAPEMRKWLEKKRDAQRKLADQMYEYTMHLEGGGTRAEWLKMQRDIKKGSQESKPSGNAVNWGDL